MDKKRYKEIVDKHTPKENVIKNLKSAIVYMKEHPEVRRQMSETAKIESKKYDEAVYYNNFHEMVNKIME